LEKYINEIKSDSSYNILFRNNSIANEIQIEGVHIGDIKHIGDNIVVCNKIAENIIADLRSKDGFFLIINANVKLSKPINITYQLDDNELSSTVLHNLIIVEDNSSSEIIFRFQDSSGKLTCSETNSVHVSRNAVFSMMRLHDVNDLISNTIVSQDAHSKMRTHYVTHGTKNVHNLLNVSLNGEKAEHHAYGLSISQDSESISNDVQIVHLSPDCQSNQLFKHILSDTSKGTFVGRIVVPKNSQQTAAFQRSNNILLSKKAKMKICPQLEIYADDVKCSHGATIGQLDSQAMFYLRARGIGEIEAKKLLLNAFAAEVINTITCLEFKQLVSCKL
jgi:Fe-S cluster assembly protein SufD